MGIKLQKRGNLHNFSEVPVGGIFLSNDDIICIKVNQEGNLVINSHDINETFFNSVDLETGAFLSFNPKEPVSYLKEDFYMDRSLFDER